ncbi:MAG: flagellar biosynthesis protein FlgC [Deltaproteobacteria bacterium]|nr:flagellar biosynthesis protein FlgC [Deltaproteobacteria bacterium]MBW2118743.1 flagellar biosynthesis protein FlgC [Deltaproteobacteria bacterium]MBW2345268.1 flagellar biosynthesis protein FlgC [Deltaproteobacteria bacterium]
MIDGIFAASSALNAFSKKVAVVSNNVANMNTDGYKKSRTILEEGQNGGVGVLIHEEGANVRTEDNSNVDLAEETVNMILAQRAYEANIKSIEAQNELEGTIVDILK